MQSAHRACRGGLGELFSTHQLLPACRDLQPEEEEGEEEIVVGVRKVSVSTASVRDTCM